MVVLLAGRAWAQPVIGTQPSTQSVVLNGTLTLTVAATGTAPLTYQWSVGGVAITGATSATYVDNAVGMTDGGSYTVVVTDGNNATTTSNAATITVTTSDGTPITANPRITIQPTNLTAIYSNGAVIPVNLGVAAVSTQTLTYQWSLNGTAITGATGAYYGATVAGSYTVAVTANGTTVTSQAATVNITTSDGTAVVNAPTITVQPASGTAVYNTTPYTLSVTAVALQTLSYQWYVGGVIIGGATSSTYATSSPGSYTVVVSDTAGSVTSSAAVVSVATSGGVSVVNAPTITVQPVGGTAIYATTPYTLSVGAVALLPLSYQWYLSGTAIAGATNSTYAASLPGSYTVVISDTAGTVTSSAATVAVMTAGGVAVTNTPTITVQPTGGAAVYSGSPVSLALSVTALSALPMTYQWYLNLAPITGAVGASYTATAPGSYTVVISTTPGSITSQAANFTVATAGGIAVNTTPVITSQPSGATIVYGSISGIATLSVSAVALLPTTYQWSLNGVAIAGATASTYPATQAGNYTVTVTTSAGSTTSQAVAVVSGSRVINLSSRVLVGPANPATAGFVLSSPTGAAKQVLIRAVGPGLASFGVTGVLTRPILNVYNGAGVLQSSNGGWSNSSSVVAADAATGAFPLTAGSADAATVVTLTPGPYSVQVTSGDGTTGAVLVEAYEIVSDSTQLVNISTLGTAGAGNSTLIAGFVLTGTQSAQVLVRAVGPGLAAYGVTKTLAQPTLTVTGNGGNLLLGTNTGWSSGSATVTSGLATAAQAAGAFALTSGSGDSAVLLSLSPGAYTAQVTGPSGATGTALVEVYLVPAN